MVIVQLFLDKQNSLEYLFFNHFDVENDGVPSVARAANHSLSIGWITTSIPFTSDSRIWRYHKGILAYVSAANQQK